MYTYLLLGREMLKGFRFFKTACIERSTALLTTVLVQRPITGIKKPVANLVQAKYYSWDRDLSSQASS